MTFDKKTGETILKFQKNELSEHLIYGKLSKVIKNRKNGEVLKHISEDELKHYNFYRSFSGKEVKANKWKVFKYVLIARLLGLTFAVKLMERGEKGAQLNYKDLSKKVPDIDKIINDEERHEHELIAMIDEEKLKYVGSIVLGLNDALVELTGALAGFTLALRNSHLIALTGLITGIAASLSMAASEYLSKRMEKDERALRASIYTGITYLVTVMFLVLPFLLLKNPILAITITLLESVLIIMMFTFYTSIAQDLTFKRRFIEMASISLGVAAISFFIGFLMNKYLGLSI